MKVITLTSVLCTLSWISTSVSEFYTVEVQSGEGVTLTCTNFTAFPGHLFWFKLGNTPNVSKISVMSRSDSNPEFFGGFKNDKFNMSSNVTVLFLKIKPVDLSDSGLYFCSFQVRSNTTFVSATYLQVQEKSDEVTHLASVILGGLIIILIIIIIVLVLKFRKLPTEGQNPQHSENLSFDDLNYAALRFHSTTANRSKRPAAKRELE